MHMKTKLITLLAAVLFSQAMMAQFHLGIKAGANITKVEGRSFKDEFRYGYAVGGFMEVRMGNKFVLQPEVLFNEYNTRLDSNYRHIYNNVINNTTENVKLNYLTVPLMLNYKLIGKFLCLQAGPQFGIKINKDKTLLQNGGDAFKSGDFSMVGGAQVKVGPLRFNGRYVVGLSNLNDIDNQEKWKNQGFQLSVGLAL
jgi:hypothetical protein